MTSELQLSQEAAEWLLRLREEPQAPDLETNFLAWLRQSAQHVRIYLETRDMYERLGEVRAAHSVNVEALLADRDADVIPLFGTKSAVSPPASGQKLLLPLALTATVLLSFGAILLWFHLRAQTFVTRVGQQLTARLDDGSLIYLNTDSRVDVQFTASERLIELVRGEALFDVQHSPDRPFIVSSGGATIRAIGTQFDIRRRDDATLVTVVEGVVQVATTTLAEAAASGHTTSPVQLSMGQSVAVGSGHLTPQPAPHLSDALSWRQRRLTFRMTPIAEVAAELNRYNYTHVLVEDLPAGALQLTGVFDVDRPLTLVSYAQKQPTLSVERRGDDWVIRSRARIDTQN